MRLVLDNNVVISGLLWGGPPRSLLEAAIGGTVEIFTSPDLLVELREALEYAKFARRLSESGATIDHTVERYLAIATLFAPAAIGPTVRSDPDDDAVLACALAAEADLVVSGDKHLLNLKHYHRIPIVLAVDALLRMKDLRGG